VEQSRRFCEIQFSKVEKQRKEGISKDQGGGKVPASLKGGTTDGEADRLKKKQGMEQDRNINDLKL